MVSFQRMRDELDDLGTHVSSKLPPIGRNACLAIILTVVLVVSAIAFGIGYAAKGNGNGSSPVAASYSSNSNPYYIYISNNSRSCPKLAGERLLTTMEEGQSFEGLVVNLACRGEYNPFPNQIKCRRKNRIDNALEWSHIPVCYPSVLVSKEHWSKTLHARSVSCKGDASGTRCDLSCIRDYIAVETEPYHCNRQPCAAWRLGDAKCFMCNQKCEQMHKLSNPRSEALLSTLGCQDSCDRILVVSDGPASIWQNKRTGLFTFLGEHNGRPVYQNNATKEFLFFTFTKSEWLVGPDFRKPHAGIQIFNSDDTSCPEKVGGKNTSRLYIDSSEPSPGGTGKWTNDDSIQFKCMPDDYKPVSCDCKQYKIFNLVYNNGTVPMAVKHLQGTFSKIDEKQYGLLAPLYYEPINGLYLFSHHPKGRMWQVSPKLSTTPLRIIFNKDDSCPDSGNRDVVWEWFNTTTDQGQQLYVKDQHVQIKCLDGRFGG